MTAVIGNIGYHFQKQLRMERVEKHELKYTAKNVVRKKRPIPIAIGTTTNGNILH
jgi:hypothetical protein